MNFVYFAEHIVNIKTIECIYKHEEEDDEDDQYHICLGDLDDFEAAKLIEHFDKQKDRDARFDQLIKLMCNN